MLLNVHYILQSITNNNITYLYVGYNVYRVLWSSSPVNIPSISAVFSWDMRWMINWLNTFLSPFISYEWIDNYQLKIKWNQDKQSIFFLKKEHCQEYPQPPTIKSTMIRCHCHGRGARLDGKVKFSIFCKRTCNFMRPIFHESGATAEKGLFLNPTRWKSNGEDLEHVTPAGSNRKVDTTGERQSFN